MKIVILGLSITSAWGNGHATTYRALVRELARRGHDVLFLERDQPWYARHRDDPQPTGCRTALYHSRADLADRFTPEIRDAEAVILGSYVPEGVAVGRWLQRVGGGTTAFYDIDTPVTLAKLQAGDHEYLAPELIPGFNLYLSFTGGPTLRGLEQEYGAQRARALYCSVDPEAYYPEPATSGRWSIGYLGTYSDDRQPTLEELLLLPARQRPQERFVVAGPQYPEGIAWGANVERIAHLNPADHRAFYCAQRWTLNVTRAAMVRAGWSPSVRLFEAAACGTPIVSDAWPGLEALFTPGEEIMVARRAEDVTALLNDVPEAERQAIGERARARVLGAHTAAHRAAELEALLLGREPSGNNGDTAPNPHPQTEPTAV